MPNPDLTFSAAFRPRVLLGALATLLLSSCTSVFFQPSRERFPFLEQDQLTVEELSFSSDDGTRLAAWYLPAVENSARHKSLVTEPFSRPRALAVQWHGNAENMTSHYRFLAWLNLHGYDLLTFDYRGYGASAGEKDVDGIYQDARAMIRYSSRLAKEKNLPLIYFGQSLGGSLLLKALQEEHPENLRLLVIESAFHGNKQIAREKLASFWLTWPLQWLAYFLVSDRYAPGGDGLEKIPRVPKIVIHTIRDPVVPFHHGLQLFEELEEPKEFWRINSDGHVVGLFVEGGRHRDKLLKIMRDSTEPR